MNKEPIKIAMITLAVLSAIAPIAYASQPPYISLAANDNPKSITISDTAITSAIKSKYLTDSEIKGLSINVVTDKGVVELSGQVPNRGIEVKATNIAQATDGVREVISKLKINDSSSINNVISDSAITTSIKSRYLADITIKGLQIHVTTINGIVTLNGQMPNDDMREKAISIARNTDGVKEVISKLEIKPQGRF